MYVVAPNQRTEFPICIKHFQNIQPGCCWLALCPKTHSTNSGIGQNVIFAIYSSETISGRHRPRVAKFGDVFWSRINRNIRKCILRFFLFLLHLVSSLRNMLACDCVIELWVGSLHFVFLLPTLLAPPRLFVRTRVCKNFTTPCTPV